MDEGDQALLAQSAPLAWRLSPTLCRAHDGNECMPGHRLWQVLRLMDLITTPVHQGSFMHGALQAALQRVERPRVLVSGAADWGMLAQLHAALSGRDADVVVVDRCETPLMLNRWYADRASLAITTVCSDILAFDGGRGFDLICTHSFLGQFPAAQREGLVRLWHDWLRPGGRVVTVNRVRPQAPAGARVGFSGEQAVALRERVRARAAMLPAALAGPEADLLAAADDYAAHHVSYPTRSLDEIRALFEGAGLRVMQLDCGPVAGAADASPTGPTTPGGADYAQIVVERAALRD